MPTSLETIRKITIRGTAEGVAETTAAVNKLTAAMGNVAVVSDTSSKRSLSAEANYRKQTMAIDETARMQAQFAKAVGVANAALNQGVITQDEHAKRMGLINDKYGQASLGAKAFQAATSGVSAQLIALSAGAGPVGTFLSALGPWGLAAAVGIGAAEKAITAMSAAAHDLAQKSRELKDFSEATGLSTAQVQALRSEASKFGVDSDQAQSAIQQFTARFNELRLGQGDLLTQMRRINPALADQMAGATDAATAMTLLGKAVQQTDNIFERNALVKAATGRGGIASAQFLSGLDVNKVTQGYVDAGKALDDNLIRKLAQLDIDIAKTSAKSKQNIASIFAEDVLQNELRYAQVFLSISEAAKGFTLSDGLKALLTGAGKGLLSMIPGGQLVNAATALIPAGKPPSKLPEMDPFGTFSAGGSYGSGTASPEYVAKQLQAQISAMGEAATQAMRLDLAQKQLAISGKEAGLSTSQLARASGILNETFANQRLQANVAAMGSAATVTEQYEARVSALSLQLAKGDISQQAFNRAVVGLKQDEYIRGLSDTLAALGDLATPMQQYQLRVAQLSQQLQQGRISQDTFNKAIIEANPLFKNTRDLTASFADNFGQALLQGKSAADAFRSALASLESQALSLVTRGLINSLFSSLTGGLSGGLTGGLFRGFGGGGYTGSGGRMEPAGFVHRGEYVFDAVTTARIGVGNLEQLRGYADGGPVGGAGARFVPASSSQTIRLEVVSRVDQDGNIRTFVEGVSGAQIASAAPHIISKATSNSLSQVPAIAAASSRQQQVRGVRAG